MSSENPFFPPKYLKQDEIAALECKTLLSSLPKERGWVASHLYEYQGFWQTARQLQGAITCQKHFEAQDSDILLVTTPKSGTTWLKAIIFTLVNRIRYPIMQNHPLVSYNPHALVPFLESKVYVDNQVPDLSSSPSPRLFSTHLSYTSLPKSAQESACKLVYLCRNPKDTFVSLWHFTNKLRTKEMGANSIVEMFDMFSRGVSIYGPFWDHVLQYWNKSKENSGKIFFLKYEDMKQEPLDILRGLAEFLGYPFTVEEEKSGMVEEILKMCSFENLSNLQINKTGKMISGEEHKAFFRCGEVGDWKNHLPVEIVEKFDQITEERLGGSGLML